MAAIEVKNITFNYPHQDNIIENISFSIDKGKSLRLEGGNGDSILCISRSSKTSFFVYFVFSIFFI